VHAISYIFWAIQVYLSYAASETIFLQLRSRLIQTLLNKPKAFFNRHPAGDLVARLVHDVDYVAGFFYQNLLRSLAYLVFCLVLIGFMILWNWKLGLLSLITLPLLYLYTAHTNLPMARRAEVSKMELSHQNEICWTSSMGTAKSATCSSKNMPMPVSKKQRQICPGQYLLQHFWRMGLGRGGRVGTAHGALSFSDWKLYGLSRRRNHDYRFVGCFLRLPRQLGGKANFYSAESPSSLKPCPHCAEFKKYSISRKKTRLPWLVWMTFPTIPPSSSSM